jgi:hypothetical protein
MANVIYECVVNKSHPRREYSAAPSAVPACCNRSMVVVPAPASVKPPMPGVSQPTRPTTAPAAGAPGVSKR